MPNVYRPAFEEGERPDGFRSRRVRIGYELGTELETVVFLAVSSSGRPDVIVYPDSDKIGFGERLPQGGGLRAFFKRGDRVGYFDGERLDEA